MKSLKILMTCRILHNRSWTQHRCLKPPIPQPSHRLHYETGNYSKNTGSRFYCISSANSLDATALSQTHQAFQPTIDIAEISNLTDDELFKMIEQLRDSLMCKTNQELREFQQTDFMKIVEEECIRRSIHHWDLDKTVDALNMFSPKARLLCRNLLIRLLRNKLKRALKSETTTMMKYVTAIDKNKFWNSYHLNVYSIEFALLRRFDGLSLSEISALLKIVNARRGRIVSQKLINDLYERLLEEIDRVDSQTLSTFLSFFGGQNTSIDFHQLIQRLLEKLRDLNFAEVDSIASFCLRKRIYNPEILDHLAEHLIKKSTELTITELETLVVSLVYFNYNSREVYQKLVEAFEVEPLRTLLLEHPKRLIKIISHLCLIEVYPHKYIDLVLSKEFLHKTFGKKLTPYTVIREAMILNGCVKTECPGYESNKLDDELENRLHSRWSSHVHHYLQTDGNTSIPLKRGHDNNFEYKPTPYNRQILDTRKILRNLLGGTEYIHTCYILPFLPKPDLLFCLDQMKNPIKLPDQVLNSVRVDYKNLDKSVDWFVVMCVHQHPILKDENIIYGKNIAKERILKKLGFKLITVVHELWSNWTEEEKRSYLKKFIF